MGKYRAMYILFAVGITMDDAKWEREEDMWEGEMIVRKYHNFGSLEKCAQAYEFTRRVH